MYLENIKICIQLIISHDRKPFNLKLIHLHMFVTVCNWKGFPIVQLITDHAQQQQEQLQQQQQQRQRIMLI